MDGLELDVGEPAAALASRDFSAAYRLWLGLAPHDPGPRSPARPHKRHKAEAADVELARPLDLIVLALKSNALRCRVPGTAREITRRTKGLTRRQFNLSLAALGGAALLPGGVLAAREAKAAAPARTKVVLVRDATVLDGKGKPKQDVVLKMLDAAVAALTGKRGLDAWRTLLRPSDVVGIKTNVWAHLSTTPAVESALKQRVLDVGVKAQDVAIDDRGVLANPVFQRATALINARPMRSHLWSGVGSLIKNYIVFSPTPASWHDDSCADLAGLWSLPIVKGKTRLNVLVMLTPQFHSVGPHGFSPTYVWRYHGLIVGFDPVACDSVGLRIIEAKRRAFFGAARPLAPPAKHIALADTRHHLGTADPAKIELVRLGYDKDALI
ncbi:MAG TPA: hypothetical protein VGQ83_02885 [Polyangia bacterium]